MDPRTSRYYTYIRPVFTNPKVRSYSPIIFSIFTMMLFGFFAIRPTIGTIIGLQKGIEEQKQILATLETKSDNLVLGNTNLQNIDEETRQKIDRLLPTYTDAPSLISALTTLAEQVDASISGLQVEAVELVGPPTGFVAKEQLQELTFTFNISGNYLNFREALRAMTEFNRLLNINSIIISRTPDGIQVMSINAKAFFFKAI